jgi:hypothetical protein
MPTFVNLSCKIKSRITNWKNDWIPFVPYKSDDSLIVNAKLASVVGMSNVLDKLPSTPSLDYGRVHGANCEIVVGYVPLPVGLVGPLALNNETTKRSMSPWPPPKAVWSPVPTAAPRRFARAVGLVLGLSEMALPAPP